MAQNGATVRGDAARRWAQVEALYDEACTLPPEQRAALLAERAGNDPDLLHEVQALLRSAETSGDLLDHPASALLGFDPIPGLAPGTRVGPWRIEERVGQGGMGEVYRARRADGSFEQQVALKLIRREAVDQLDRFHEERRMLALLDHPGIARLFDGGVADDGRPYMVIEWVDGRPLTDWCSAHASGLRERLDVFLQVCAAVGYAHRNLLVHRDLKPGNVLVNAEGRVKLLDFGVAKLLAPTADLAQLTVAPMTPAYAAPEQLLQGTITTATDLYALGLILFELLTGQRPFHRPQMSLAQLIDRLRDAPAPSISTVHRGVDAPPIPPRQLRGDLEAIVAKALRKEPEHRYETVAALESDLQRHLRGEPVSARRGARGYVLGRFLLRYRWAVAGVSTLIVTLAAGLAGTVWQAQRAETQARRALAVQDFLSDVFRANSDNQADPIKAQQTTARELLDIGARKIDGALADAPEARLSVLRLFGDLYDDLNLPDEALKARRQEVELARRLYADDSPELVDSLLALVESLNTAAQTLDQDETRRTLLEEATRILDRREDHTSERRGRLWWLWAAQYTLNDKPRALEAGRKAVQVLEALPPSAELVSALIMLGREELLARNLPAAIATFRRGLEVAEQLGSDFRSALAELHAQLGDAQFRAGDIANAEQNSRRGMALALQINGEDSIDAVMAGLKLGVLLFDTGRVSEALAMLESAKVKALKSQDGDSFTTHYALLRHGYHLARAGSPTEGLVDIRAAVAMLGADTPPVLRASALERMADDALVALGRFKEARDDLDEARRIRIAAGQDESSAAVLGNTCAAIRLALAEGRADDAARLASGLPVPDPANVPWPLADYDRELLRAEVALAAGQPGAAMDIASRVRRQIEAAGIAIYVKERLARAHLIEGRVRMLDADAARALAPFETAAKLLQVSLLDSSPRIAEAYVAIAMACLELEDLACARTQAKAAHDIHARHRELGEQYRAPLRVLDRRLKQPGS